MASDTQMSDQQMPEDGSLAEMFATADNAIERHKTANIFKQLDERSLTEQEEKIIQQRVDLQRRLLLEYEKRELKRKVSELQEMWPDLSEAAASRALDLCNGKEEEAVLRLTDDAAFTRRVILESGGHLPATIVLPSKARSSRGSSGSSSRSTTRIISPSELNGRVFVGRFRSKLGPYQVSEAAAAGPSSSAAAAAAAAAGQQTRKRGRPCKASTAAAAVQPIDAATAAALSAPPASRLAALADGSAAAAADVAAALSAAAALAAGGPADAVSNSPTSNKRSRSSSSPDSSEQVDQAAVATAAAAGFGDAAGGGGGSSTDSGTDTDAGRRRGVRTQQQQQQVDAPAEPAKVVSLMARRIARLEPLVAAERLLEFEGRRPDSAAATIQLLADEYGPAVSDPIATAWEVLLEEQKLNESQGLAAMLLNASMGQQQQQQHATSSRAAEPPPAAAPATTSQGTPPRRSSRLQSTPPKAVPGEAAAAGHGSEQQQQLLAALGQIVHQAAAAAVVPAASDSATITDPGVAAATADAVAATATSAPSSIAAAAAEAAGPSSSGRGSGGRRAAAVAAAAVSAAAAAEMRTTKGRGKAKAGGGGGGGYGSVGGGSSRATRAISETGHTCRGRVKQKSHKTTELVEVGELHVHPAWFNAGYIFPDGFKTRLLFRSSVDLDALCLHECEIVGKGGKFWPAPTFVVTARDREDEPIVAKSCTGCWSGILKRINAVITQRIAAGESLPPPPRTAIAGPEYFGLNDSSTQAAIEALDPECMCSTYWEGKRQREAALSGLPFTVQPLPPRANTAAAAAAAGGGGGGGGRKRGRPRGSGGGGADADADDEGEEAGYRGNHWSSISRRERYHKRCTEAGDEVPVDQENLLPGVLDPVTLEPVVNPAISPAGHVMGLATWKAVLSETGRCPFTKAPLRPDNLTVLTANNIERHRARIIAM